jgi:hypothetical protein
LRSTAEACRLSGRNVAIEAYIDEKSIDKYR